MSKVERSLWRCTVSSRVSETGSCDVVIEQHEMEDHLRKDHQRSLLSPGDVIPHFVLVRSSDLGRGPGRRKAVEDETMTMFERDDYR